VTIGQIDLGDIQVLAMEPDSVARLVEGNIDSDLAAKSLLRRINSEFDAISIRYDSIAEPAHGRFGTVDVSRLCR
jgi:hypothetical protein